MTTGKTMRASWYDNYGAPTVLQVRDDLPIPSCAADEVLIRVKYSTVTRTDCGFLRAAPFIVRLFAGLTKPRSKILGCEFSGEIVETGSDVTDFVVGERAFGFKDDDFGFGGHAEFTCMPTKGLIAKIPEHLSFAQAAPGLEGAHYALHYIRSANIGASHRVLVNGGTGGIGSAAVQIIRALGADVTAVCGTAHTELLKELGASRVIDYQMDDFTQLFTATDDQFDVVFDAVGKSTFGKCKRILKPNGLYLSTELGPFCQNPFLALITPLFKKQKVLFPIPKNDRKDAEYLSSLMQCKQYTPLIDKTFPFCDIVSAYDYVESGEKIGNVLIKIEQSSD